MFNTFEVINWKCPKYDKDQQNKTGCNKMSRSLPPPLSFQMVQKECNLKK